MINLLIFALFLSYSRCIENEPFVWSTRNKISITHYIIYKYLALYNITKV